MKIAYFNCSAGIAGDMIIASCISAGLSAEVLGNNLKNKLRIGGWSLKVTDVTKGHFPAVHLDVSGKMRFGSPEEMKSLVAKSILSIVIKKRCLKIFDTLISAEAKVHKLPPKKIHFHEINSIDTLIDITGTVLAFDMMGISEIYSSPLNLGKPAPATVEIVRSMKVPVYSSNSRVEMTTPTGAAIISTVANSFGDMPEMNIENSGAGAGSFDFKDIPNILGLIVGVEIMNCGTPRQIPMDVVKVIETNIDDMDTRIYPYVMEKLFACGAKDVWFNQVIMKKGRPGIVLSVICSKENEKSIMDILFKETTTLGIRSHSCSRHVLKRDICAGKKTAFIPGSEPRIKSEFESAKIQAQTHGKPLKSILI